MWILVILALVGCGCSVKLDRTYLPPPGYKILSRNQESLVNPNHSFDTATTLATGLKKTSTETRVNYFNYEHKHSNVPETYNAKNTRYSTIPPVSLKNKTKGSNNYQVQNEKRERQKIESKLENNTILHSEISKSATDIVHGQDTETYVPDVAETYVQLSGGSILTGTLAKNAKLEDHVLDKVPVASNSISHGENKIQTEQEVISEIIQHEQLITPNINYYYNYETSNGIKAEESASIYDGVQVQGSYSYIGDDGRHYTITYTADENGFVPHGDHLPTAPPTPEAILRVIEQALKDREAGVEFDDGMYDESKYGFKNYETKMLNFNNNKRGKGALSFKTYGNANNGIVDEKINIKNAGEKEETIVKNNFNQDNSQTNVNHNIEFSNMHKVDKTHSNKDRRMKKFSLGASFRIQDNTNYKLPPIYSMIKEKHNESPFDSNIGQHIDTSLLSKSYEQTTEHIDHNSEVLMNEENVKITPISALQYSNDNYKNMGLDRNFQQLSQTERSQFTEIRSADKNPCIKMSLDTLDTTTYEANDVTITTTSYDTQSTTKTITTEKLIAEKDPDFTTNASDNMFHRNFDEASNIPIIDESNFDTETNHPPKYTPTATDIITTTEIFVTEDNVKLQDNEDQKEPNGLNEFPIIVAEQNNFTYDNNSSDNTPILNL